LTLGIKSAVWDCSSIKSSPHAACH